MARTTVQIGRKTTTAARSATGKAARTGRRTAADLAFLARALKAPALLDADERLPERVQAESWTHLEYLVACLQREVAAREAHGSEGRIRAARFPAIKTIEELDLTHLRDLTRQQLAHLGTPDLIAAEENAVFLGPPGTGKTHIATNSPSEPARKATGSSSPPPPSGSTAWPPPVRPIDSRTSWSSWAVTH
jgi:IstB-like ATP binding protein